MLPSRCSICESHQIQKVYNRPGTPASIFFSEVEFVVGKIKSPVEADGDWLLVELLELLQKIDEHGKLAELNETSIADNNGGAYSSS